MFLNTLLAALVNFSSIFIYSFEHIDGPLNEDRDIYFAPSVSVFSFYSSVHTSWFWKFIFCDGRLVLWCASFFVVVPDLLSSQKEGSGYPKKVECTNE